MFVPILAKPDRSDVEQDGTEVFIVTTFCQCGATRRFGAVKSKLSLMIDSTMFTEYVSPHEFSFEIEISNLLEPDQDYSTQDRTEVRRCVGDACALTIMPIVVQQLELLIAAVAPPVIYRVTKMRTPTAGALVKHNLLTSVLQSLGYDVHICDFDGFSRAYWIMERLQGALS